MKCLHRRRPALRGFVEVWFKIALGTLQAGAGGTMAYYQWRAGIELPRAEARLRRLGGNLEEASMDLGAGTFRTFWSITLPMMRSALLAGALLSFALSFDEIIVTTFTAGQGIQTLPLWIYQNLFRPNQAPVVNVVAAVLVVFSAVPIYLALRLSGNSGKALTGAR